MERIVSANNLKLWTESFGDKDQPCVLLIAGAGGLSVFWPLFFCEKLATAGHFVIRYDHRDVGYSTHFPVTDNPQKAVYTIFDLINDVFVILDAYDIKSSHIVGHSMGGYMAELMAIHHSARIKTSTIISAGPSVDPEVNKKLNLPVAAEETTDLFWSNPPIGDFDKDLVGLMERWKLLHGSYPIDEELALTYAKEIYKRDIRDALWPWNHIAAETAIPKTLADEIKTIKVPCLVIHGEEDNLLPKEHGVALSTMIPNAKLRIIPKAGHLFFNKELWNQIAEDIAYGVIK